MDEFEIRLKKAQQNKEELDYLLRDYLPFVKKQLEGLSGLELEYDDMLSLAMMVFVNCISQYTDGKGGFFSFAKVSIRNRLIDEGRRARRHSGITLLSWEAAEKDLPEQEAREAIRHYERDWERRKLKEEIEEFSEKLGEFDITMKQLAVLGPRQSRARKGCLDLAQEIVKEPGMMAELMETKRIRQRELARRMGISPKTVEKHRKYIVALVILLNGDYSGIQAFLPREKEAGT